MTAPMNASDDKWLTDLLDKHGLAYLVTDSFDFIEELNDHYEQRMQEEYERGVKDGKEYQSISDGINKSNVH